MLIRRIRELLYEQGFTISGARNKLDSSGAGQPAKAEALDLLAVRAELSAILGLLRA
jgi:hypothetical protein